MERQENLIGPIGRILAQVVISMVVLRWRSCSRSWAGAVISRALS